MAKIVNPLTFAKIKAAKPKDKLYKLSDGGGLSLWVYPSGRMRWAFKYREDGKQKNAYLGEYPIYSLSDAREWRESLRSKVGRGEQVIEEVKNNTPFLFDHVYADWYERWSPQKKSEKYAKQVKAAIDLNILPILGGKDIREIRPFDIVESLRGMEKRGVLDYLIRTKSSLSLLFGYAVDSGLIDFNPVKSIGSQAFKKPGKKHFEALAPDQLSLLIQKLNGDYVGVITRCAIYWQLLTMTRPIESVSAQWEHINKDKNQWIIPPEIMKKSREHIIPLSPLALEVLAVMEGINTNGIYLFEGLDRSKHLSRETPRIILRRVGVPSTAHGLRSLGATILEEAGYPEPVIKAALSHAKGSGDQSTAAYLRSTFYSERVEAMNYLSDLIQKNPHFKGFL